MAKTKELSMSIFSCSILVYFFNKNVVGSGINVLRAYSELKLLMYKKHLWKHTYKQSR